MDNISKLEKMSLILMPITCIAVAAADIIQDSNTSNVYSFGAWATACLLLGLYSYSVVIGGLKK